MVPKVLNWNRSGFANKGLSQVGFRSVGRIEDPPFLNKHSDCPRLASAWSSSSTFIRPLLSASRHRRPHVFSSPLHPWLFGAIFGCTSSTDHFGGGTVPRFPCVIRGLHCIMCFVHFTSTSCQPTHAHFKVVTHFIPSSAILRRRIFLFHMQCIRVIPNIVYWLFL